MITFKRVSYLLVCCCLLFSSFHAGAWSLAWHGTIASSALDGASEGQQKTLIAYANVLSSEFSAERKDWQRRTRYEIKKPSSSAALAEKAAYEAAWLAAWPDLIRSQKLSVLFKAVGATTPANLAAYKNHTTSTWHYHNVFYDSNNKLLLSCNKKNRGKLYSALSALESSLQSDLSISQQAIVFAFYIHLVGDAHQPLHNVSRANKHCEHDRGGNTYCLKKKVAKCSLSAHQFWDLAAFNPVEPIDIQPAKHKAACGTSPVWGSDLLAEAKELVANLYPKNDDFNNAKYRSNAKSIAKSRIEMAASRTAQIMKCYLRGAKK